MTYDSGVAIVGVIKNNFSYVKLNIGAKKMAQLEDNLKSVEVSLTQEEIDRISATTQLSALYPQWMIERQNPGIQTRRD